MRKYWLSGLSYLIVAVLFIIGIRTLIDSLERKTPVVENISESRYVFETSHEFWVVQKYYSNDDYPEKIWMIFPDIDISIRETLIDLEKLYTLLFQCGFEKHNQGRVIYPKYCVITISTLGYMNIQTLGE